MLREIEIFHPNRLSYKGKTVSPQKVRGWIVEGDVIRAVQADVECTKELLVDLTFNKYLSTRLETYKEFKNCLEHMFTENQLYDFLENGGIEMWVQKKKKGLLNAEA